MERALLGVVDYLIFAVMLAVSAGIGVYFRFSGGKQKTTDEYLLAGKNMSIVPVAFSLMASFLSAITVIGLPAEIYNFGIHLVWMNLGYMIGRVVNLYLSLPVYFQIQVSTAYEYIERRFGKWARSLTSLAFAIQMILFMSVVLYAPAIALSAVSNLSLWMSVVSVGVVCTFYCTLGGMKAVLWTDVFQAILMFLGLFAILIKGFLDFGFSEVFKIAYDNGRVSAPGFQLDATTRYTFWNVFLQGLIISMAELSNQIQVQRLLTVRNLSKSRQALLLSMPMGASFHLLNCISGLVIYAYFSKCDPMSSSSHPISRADQLVPYFMTTTLGKYPGLSGLCICGLFSASLSTVSSAVNSLTAVTVQDIVKPFLEKRGMQLKKPVFTAKAITLFYGVLCVLLTFLVDKFGSLVQSAFTISGMFGGPVLAIFLLGMLTTRSNEKGVIVGLILGTSFIAWISFGSSAHAPFPKTLPVSLEGCDINATFWDVNRTSTTPLTTTSPISLSSPSEFLNTNESLLHESPESSVFPLYTISFVWFVPIGFCLTFILGYIASLVVNVVTGEEMEVSEDLLSPLVKWKWRRTFNIKEKERNMKTTDSVELEGFVDSPREKAV